MIIQTEYYEESNKRGFVSIVNASDIINAFVSGKNVIVHFPEQEADNYTIPEKYISISYYTASTATYDEQINIPTSDSNQYFASIYTDQNGKLRFEL